MHMQTSILVKGAKRIGILLLASALIFSVFNSTGCSSLKKNGCGCPSKRGLGGY
jgi:hypothetical protein